MAYKLNFSDYSTASGPPDPAAWVGPPGPPGPVGPKGDQGDQGVAGNPFPEAPNDGALYGRGGATVVWSPVLPLAGGALSGPLTLAADPTLPLGAVTKRYADTAIATVLPLAGGTMGGPIVLPGNATLPLQAVPLQQLTAAIASAPFVPIGGGSMGALTVTHLNISSLPLAQSDGSPPVGAISGDLYNNGGFVCVKP